MFRTLASGALAVMSLSALPASAQFVCQTIADFTSPEEQSQWRTQNDDVMGGKSVGGPSFEEGHLTFSGRTNMDGGGFSSIRAFHAVGAFAEADAVRLTLKTDGRKYQVSFRTNDRDMWRRRYSFRADIPQTPVGEWTTVTVAITDLPATIWGQKKSKPFDRTKVSEYGLFIYDGTDGPFSLEVKTLEVCARPPGV